MQHRQTLPEEAEKDAAHEFEIRFSFHHDLPSPLPRGVSAFVYSPWASVVKKKKRHAPPPPPPASRLCEDVQSSAFHMYNAYEVISIQTHKEITIISNAPRLLTTFSSNSSLEAMKEPKEFPQAGKNKTIPQHVSASTTNVHDSKGRSPRGASKKDNLKQRKNNSHVSIVKRNMEAGKKGASRARKEAKEERGKITKEPTYEEIEDYLDDSKNVIELAALLGRRLDQALQKPTVSESCASSTRNKGMSSASNKQLPAKPRPKKGEAEAVKGTSKVRGAVSAKENVRDCDCVCSDEVCCDAMVTPQRSPPEQTKGKPQSHKTDSSRPNGNIKTYIFGEQPTGEPTKKKRALKERQCHLAVASPRSQGRGHKAREGHARALSTEFATEKRQKRGSSAGLLRTSFKASARKYKDNVVHTYRKRHPKHDKHHDAYGSAGRHFVHQIPRVVISCENLTESRKANSLSRIRDSFRRRPAASDPRCTHVQESGEESANEHSRRSRPRDARDFLREEDESPEKCRGKSRSHSTTREDRRAPYENLERSKSVHAKRRTPRRDSPSLSDDLYVRRKSRGPRIDLAKMR